MSARAINATQVSDGRHQETEGDSPLSLPPNGLSASQVNERPFIKLKVTRGKSDIVNSVVVNAAGQSLFSISSDSKRTTMVACKNNIEVATVEWNRSSPRMVFRRKKMKCKEWLPLAGPEKYMLTNFVYAVILNLTVSLPDLVCSHTVTHDLFGRISHLHLATYVNSTARRLFSKGANRTAVANPCQPIRSLRRTVAHQIPF
jgi:hypothetical protein